MGAVETVGIELIVEGMQQVLKQLGTVDKSINELGGTAQKSSSILDGALATALGVGIVKAASAALDAIVGLGKAFVGFAAESFDMAVDFQTSLVGLEIAASATGLSFDTLHAAAIQVGGDTSLLGVSASGAAEAMTGLFKAGLSNVEVFGDLEGYLAGTAELGGALRASIDLAAATEMDMVQASELAAVALATFGGGLETAAERSEFVNTAMNNMVQAADASVASVSELADAMVNVGPTAAALGMPIEDMNNSLAILSMRGIRGAEAGTALKSMLVNLQRPTPAVTQALDKLNVSLYDAQGEFVGMESLVGQLETAYADLTPEQRNLNSQIIAGSYGMNALNSLLGAGVQGWGDMAEATLNAATIQEQAAAYADTYAGKLEALEGNMETLKIQIGEALLPVATELLGWFGQMIEQYGPMLVTAFEGIVTSLQPFIEFVGKVITAIATFGAVIGSATDPLHAVRYALITAFGQETADTIMGIVKSVQEFIPDAIETFRAALEKLIPIVGAVGAVLLYAQIPTIIAAITTAFAAVAAVIATISAPLLIVVGLIALLGAIVAANWATIQPILQMLWDAFVEAFEAIAAQVQSAWPMVQEAFAQLGAAFGELFTALQPVIQVLGVVLVGALGIVVGAIGGVIQAVLAIITGLAMVLNGVVTFASGVINVVIGLVEMIIGLISGNTEAVQASFEKMKTGVIQIFLGLLTAVVGVLAGLVSGAIALIEGFVVSAVAFFTSLYNDLVGGSIIPDMVNAIIKWIGELPAKATILFGEFVTAAVTAVTALPGKLSEIFETIKVNISTAVESIKAFFTNTDWGAVGQSIIDGIAAGITAAAGAIASAASAAAQAALDAAKGLLGIKSPSSVFRDEVGKNIDYGIAAGVADFTPVITKQMGNLTGALLPALGGMTQMLSGLAPASAAGRTTNYNSNASSNSVTNNMIHLTPALALESVGMTIAA